MAQQNPTNTIQNACLDTIRYFSVFEYPVTDAEVHTFLRTKATLQEVKNALRSLARSHALEYHGKSGQYALRGHGICFQKRADRRTHTHVKLHKARAYARMLSYVPYISFVGVSGSCAMLNAKESDDIDICIMSAPGCMWLSRVTAILIAKLMVSHRSRGSKKLKDTLCLNLFFDSSNMVLPIDKRTLYGAHEIVQMLPVYIRGGVYIKFFRANAWVKTLLPQTRIPRTSRGQSHSGAWWLFWPCERLAKWFQLWIMHERRGERIGDTQLWFFPDDFEKKLKRKLQGRS